MASAPASHPGRAVDSPGWAPPAAGARATETLGERPRPSSSPSPTSPTRTTTVEDSRRNDPILVPGRPGAGCTYARRWRPSRPGSRRPTPNRAHRPQGPAALVRRKLHWRLGPCSAWRGQGHAIRVPPVDPEDLAGLIAPYATDGGPGHAV